MANKKKKEVNIQDVVSGIAQAAANAWDGSHDERFVRNDKELVQIGLRREEGDLMKDNRIMDGFSVYFQGPNLCIKYHSTFTIEEMHEKGFDQKISNIVDDVAAFLKKEYKKVTGNSVTLTPVKDAQVPTQAQYISRIRAWLFACKWYTIGGLEDKADSLIDGKVLTSSERLEKTMKDWLNQGEAKDDKYRGA